MTRIVLLFTLALATAAPICAQTPETLADIRVHGNVLTPDDDIRRLAGVTIGSPFTAETLDEVGGRLRRAGRFQDVQVLKRYASIADPTQILLVIVVDEGAVKIEMTGDTASPTRVVKKRWPPVLMFPILSVEDGYGLRYGMQFGLADKLGPRSRIAFPLTWGGERKAGAEFDKQFPSGPITRLTGGVALSQRTNPFFDEPDRRGRVWIRAERGLGRFVRLGADAGRDDVTFGGSSEPFAHGGADATVDTRSDAIVPRNAIHVRASIARLNFAPAPSGQGATWRWEIDARGYLGLFGQSVLAVRGLHNASDRPLPAYEKALLGGMANLRGFHAGTAVGDRLDAGSIEMIVPLTSPLSVGRLGVSGFVDTAAVYGVGERLVDQELRRGVGATVWFSAAMVRVSVVVAHGVGATTRVHVGGSVLF